MGQMMHRQANKPIDLESDLGPITDDDVCDAAKALGLAVDAFWASETDRRAEAMKSLRSVDVASCPGSGKTTLLVAKLALLTDRWPYRTRGLCVLSHTNAARREIENRLGGTATGAALLGYPHYVGTIHSFVAQFVAGPWMRSLGLPIKIIDTDIAQRHRLALLPQNICYNLRNEKSPPKPEHLEIVDSDLSITVPKTGSHTATYQGMQSACELSSKAGYHTFNEVFMWARDCLSKRPLVQRDLRGRFPLLCVDEAQDCDGEQEELLRLIFAARERASVLQRFGDANQAIFNSVQIAAAERSTFFAEGKAIVVAESHRFGRNIASLAEPFAVRGEQLIGRGPARGVVDDDNERTHTVFLFDEATIADVLPAYGEYLLSQFNETELRRAECAAVGMIHRSTPSNKLKRPGHVGHYWPPYAPELARSDPHPERLAGYIAAAHSQGSAAGVEMAPVVAKVAEAVLHGARLVSEDNRFKNRRNAHRFVIQELVTSEEPDHLQAYRKLIQWVVVERCSKSAQRWDELCEEYRKALQGLTASTASSLQLDAFLQRPERGPAIQESGNGTAATTNEYVHSKEGRDCRIRLGSIHSVKGQTHTATLVLETHWMRCDNLAKLKPWLLGKRKGLDGEGVQQESRLKVHYVAMTRPTHLLCLAMKRSSFNDAEMEQLKGRGWMIKDLTSPVSAKPPYSEV